MAQPFLCMGRESLRTSHGSGLFGGTLPLRPNEVRMERGTPIAIGKRGLEAVEVRCVAVNKQLNNYNFFIIWF